MSKYVYGIDALIPPNESKLGFWGFNSELDPEFAAKARDTRIPEEVENNLQQHAGKIIQGFGLAELGEIKNPYHFMEESYLLHFVTVPGDACELGLGSFCQDDFFEDGWRRLKEAGITPEGVIYVPHNVDSKDQAFCLQTLWLHWANGARSILED